MALRDWPARRIGFLWLVGVVVYGSLVVLGESRRRERDARWREEFGPTPDMSATSETIPVARRDSLAGLMFALIRETSRGSQAHRDSVLEHLTAVVRDTPLTTQRRDSLYRALNVPVRLSAGQKDSLQSSAESLLTPIVTPIATGIARGMSGMGTQLVISAVLFFAPGVALLTLTIVWAYSRRHHSLKSGAAAV
jgi:hypothetical protein